MAGSILCREVPPDPGTGSVVRRANLRTTPDLCPSAEEAVDTGDDGSVDNPVEAEEVNLTEYRWPPRSRLSFRRGLCSEKAYSGPPARVVYLFNAITTFLIGKDPGHYGADLNGFIEVRGACNGGHPRGM